jgi:TonB family protein
MRADQQSYSTPFAPATDPQGILCRWDAAGGAQRVTLNPSLIRELRKSAIEAFLAIPRRGIEIGGLLFGQVRQDPLIDGAETAVFEIAAFEDVPCEHRFGPSYVLDEMDRTRLGELLARHQRDGSPPIVGFYRSYTGREAQLDDADQVLIRTFFPHRHFACLLLQPLSMEKCAAGFQFCGEGEVFPEPAYAPFPFEAALMKQETVELPAGPPPANLHSPAKLHSMVFPRAAEEPPASPAESRRPSPALPPWYELEDTAAPRAGRFRLVLSLLLCVVAAIAAIAIYELWKTTREPRWVQLGLDAQPSARELVVSWDRSAPTVQQATRGVLAVTDGRTPLEIQLSADQVHHGSFSYPPSHPDLRLQLRLYDQDRPVAADSLRVIGLPNPAPVTATVPAEPATPTAPAAPASHPQAHAAADPKAAPLAVLHQVEPAISPGIRARIQAPVVVPVMVNVDQSGRVTRAWSKVTGHGLQRYLADAAVQAARKWSFAPARSQDGSAVAATKTLSFEFRPPAQ